MQVKIPTNTFNEISERIIYGANVSRRFSEQRIVSPKGVLSPAS